MRLGYASLPPGRLQQDAALDEAVMAAIEVLD